MSETLNDTGSKKPLDYMDVPGDEILGTMRYLADLGIVDQRGYRDHGYFHECDECNRECTEGKLYRNQDSLYYAATKSGGVRVEATTGYEMPQGRYDVHFFGHGTENTGYRALPFVHVKRGEDYKHSFRLGSKYSTRAAELVIQLVNRKMAELGHKEVAVAMERARIAQAALNRYEKESQ